MGGQGRGGAGGRGGARGLWLRDQLENVCSDGLVGQGCRGGSGRRIGEGERGSVDY